MNTLENTSELHRAEAPTTKTMAQAESCPVCSGGQVAEFLAAPDRYHWRKQIYRLTRCSSCECVWLSGPPQPAEMGLHYTEDYHRAIVAAGEGCAAERWKDQVKLISDFKRAGAILDIGCSSGGFLSTMPKGAWQLYGIEMEESTAVRARANAGAEVFVGDAMDAPFPSGSFDVITCFDVLEHVYSPREFLTKVLSWLKPGGIFYSMMPNIASWEAQVFGTHWYGLELPRHLFHFSPNSLRHLMAEIGFTEAVVKTPGISYVERSTGYVCSSLIEKMGIAPRPQAKPKPASLPWKVVRKGIRLSVIRPLAHIAASAGAGPCLEVVFQKPQPSPVHSV